MSKLPGIGRIEDLYGMVFLSPWLKQTNKQTKLSGVLSLFGHVSLIKTIKLCDCEISNVKQDLDMMRSGWLILLLQSKVERESVVWVFTVIFFRNLESFDSKIFHVWIYMKIWQFSWFISYGFPNHHITKTTHFQKIA